MKLNSAETYLKAKIDSEIQDKFVTESKNYVDDKVLEFEKHVTEQLSQKADKSTVESLDEFFKVVNSAIQIQDPETEKLYEYN
jgi:hypothetical protein